MVADVYLQFRNRAEAALGALLKLAAEMQRESATLDTLQNMLRDIREPLLFVVVGEVKAGKSSLLNALFGQESVVTLIEDPALKEEEQERVVNDLLARSPSEEIVAFARTA